MNEDLREQLNRIEGKLDTLASDVELLKQQVGIYSAIASQPWTGTQPEIIEYTYDNVSKRWVENHRGWIG